MRDLATALDGHGGISSITLNSDYTLTFTLADDTEVTTTSVRGATGAKGDKGTDGRAITSVTKTGTSGLVDTYKIQFSDNTSTTFTVTNGSSIKSIAKTGTNGLVDTYTVTLTDNTSSTFTVTNGNGIASITLQSGTHAAGTTDVYKITFDNGQYTTFSVYNGLNGSGSVVSVNEKSPDAAGNVALSASDVGAPTTEQFSTLQTTVNGKQPATNSLTAEVAIANADYFPFYDASANANRKALLSNIIGKIRAVLFGSANGFLKANGSGTISAVATVPVASGGTGAATAAAARENLGISYVNPNLLDNWYFAHPVNQRGLTTYTGSAYTIDRWRTTETTTTLAVTAAGIKLSDTGTEAYLQQYIEAGALPEGETYTMSLLTADGDLLTATGVLSTSWVFVDATWGVTSFSQNAEGLVTAGITIKSAGYSKILRAAKFELGDHQTLAHKDASGSWVLNEIPDYGEQLRRCQRYYYQVHYAQYQTINLGYEDTGYAFFLLPLPVAMRTTAPVLTQSAPIQLGTSSKTMQAAEANGCAARLACVYTAISNPAGAVYSTSNSADGVTFTLSADL